MDHRSLSYLVLLLLSLPLAAQAESSETEITVETRTIQSHEKIEVVEKEDDDNFFSETMEFFSDAPFRSFCSSHRWF